MFHALHAPFDLVTAPGVVVVNGKQGAEDDIDRRHAQGQPEGGPEVDQRKSRDYQGSQPDHQTIEHQSGDAQGQDGKGHNDIAQYRPEQRIEQADHSRNSKCRPDVFEGNTIHQPSHDEQGHSLDKPDDQDAD